jgi:hypothetical protein
LELRQRPVQMATGVENFALRKIIREKAKQTAVTQPP